MKIVFWSRLMDVLWYLIDYGLMKRVCLVVFGFVIFMLFWMRI